MIHLKLMKILIFFALVALPIFADAPQPQPKIVFEKTEHDFGTISNQNKVSTNFSFKNNGDAPLKINQVKTTCGCTVGRVPNQEFKPGDTGEIEVTFNPHGKTGSQHKQIQVLSNDPQNPSTPLTIKALIRTDWSIIPSFHRFSYDKGQTVILRMRAISESTPAVKIKNIIAPDSIKIQKISLQKEQQWMEDIMLEFTPISENFFQTVTIELDNPSYPPQEIQLYGRQSPPIDIIPAKIFFGKGQKVRQITLKSNSNQPFQIESLNCVLLGFKFETMPSPKPNEITIKATIETPQPISQKGILIVKTNHPNALTLKIPIYTQV